MKIINLLLVLSLLGFSVACSSSKNTADEAEVSEVADAGAETAEEADFVVDEEDDLLAEDEEISADESEEVAQATDEEMKEEAPLREVVQAKPEINDMDLKEYTVEKGDTLMFVAFKLFGDYRKWRELSKLNGIASGTQLQAGSIIKYQGADFSWEPQGLPYLIKWGDTLSKISDDKYGTWKRWKEIHENNRSMIQDPNLIFAGFTLYYIPDRDLASE